MPQLLHNLLLETAQRSPGKIAVRFRNQEISYGQLDNLSEKLSFSLIRHGICRGDRVGIYLDKSIEGLISIFGILKSGACYVPLDPLFPVKRHEYILHDCAIKYLITSSSKFPKIKHLVSRATPIKYIINLGNPQLNKNVFSNKVKVISLPEIIKSDTSKRKAKIRESDLAYILYTSGSTGEPKGVMITHQASLAFINWAAECFSISKNDKIAGVTPFYFDISIFDIFVTVKAGATLCIVPSGVSAFPLSLADFIEQEKISVWYSVPYPLIQLLIYGNLKNRKFPCLKKILFAGEVFPVRYLNELSKIISHAKFYNLYGPTETNVCTYYQIHKDSLRKKIIPIGKACSQAEVVVVNEENETIRPGQIGELLVNGPSLMKGYWNNPKNTKTVFVRGNFLSKRNKKFYRTGDLVTIDNEGNYIFVDRKDNMIKNRGYRIELGEIESILCRHPRIKEAAVLVASDDGVEKKIKAVIVPKDACTISKETIRHFCFQHLPSYMIPDIWEIRKYLPRTLTGKINRSFLERESYDRKNRRSKR
jgi:amino acid adenylation domain-containing protein